MPRCVLCFILLAVCIAWEQTVADEPLRPLPPIEVYFSPKGGCTDAIIKELKAAKSTVLVQAYWFTSEPIAKALVGAHKRGVKVEVILVLQRHFFGSTFGCFASHVLRCESVACLLRSR